MASLPMIPCVGALIYDVHLFAYNMKMAEWIFLKSGMGFISLEADPNSFLLIFCYR
jgi:hypothetical protein